MNKWKSVKLSTQNKALLSILIREIQECSNMNEVNLLLDSWIQANDLHPENVETMAEKEFNLYKEDRLGG